MEQNDLTNDGWKRYEPASVSSLCDRAYMNATRKGFHEYTPVFGKAGQDARHILSWLCLVTTEASEAAEEVRKGRDRDAFTSELADICIRTFDMAAALGLNLEQAILDKMEKNESRPNMHGGKLA